jgi:AraC-like DNA-binding protein
VYRELAAPADPYGLYACVWSRFEPARGVHRIVPDGCMDIMWHRESGAVTVAGPDTRAQVGPIDPGTLIAIRFNPGGGPAALGIPAGALRDRRVPLDELWGPSRARRLADALAAAPSDVDAQRVLTRAVNDSVGEPRDDVATWVLKMLRSGETVTSIASTVGLSERQLHRRCLAAFGYGPKVLHRVLRFELALRLARAGIPFAEVATRAGYADQAHLSREVKALSGVPLGSLTTHRPVGTL